MADEANVNVNQQEVYERLRKELSSLPDSLPADIKDAWAEIPRTQVLRLELTKDAIGALFNILGAIPALTFVGVTIAGHLAAGKHEEVQASFEDLTQKISALQNQVEYVRDMVILEAVRRQVP